MFTHLCERYFEKSVLGIKLQRTSCALNVPALYQQQYYDQRR
jgi:hypothetical protein